MPVVTNIAPFRALTDEGAVGALWESGHAPSLITALTRVMSRPLEAQRAAAQALFERSFSWPMIGRRAVTIYRDVIASRALVRD